MVGKPREVIMDFRMAFCPSGGPFNVSGGNGCGSANRAKYQPQVTLDMNSHPPVLNTVPAKPSASKGVSGSRGGGQLFSCFRNMYNFVKSGSQPPVTWVNPGLVSQLPPPLPEAVYPEAHYLMPETTIGQNMPLWYAATPGSNMDYQEPFQSLMCQEELQSHYKVIPNYKGGLSKPSKPLNPEAKEWVPRKYLDGNTTMSSTPSCSVLSSTNVQKPLVITTAVAVGFVEFTDEEINEVKDENEKVEPKNLHGNSTQNYEKTTSNSSQINTSQINKNVLENCRLDAPQNIEAWKNMKNEIQKKSCEMPDISITQKTDLGTHKTDLGNMETRSQGDCTKEVNLSYSGVTNIQTLQEVKSGSHDQSQDSVQCSYASITRKSPEPQKSVEVSVEKNQTIPIIFTKDKKYPKEKAAPLMDCKKREPLPFKTVSKKQKNFSKKFIKELKEQSPVRNCFSYSGSDSTESDPEIISRLSGSGSPSSSAMSPQETVSICMPRVEKSQHSKSENKERNCYNRTTSESSTSSIDIEFEDCNISCESIESNCLPTSKHTNSILAHILGLDSESEDDEDDESDDDWDNVTDSGCVLDDSWETFGLTVNLTPKINLPHSSRDCVDTSESENACDSISSNNFSTNMDEVNERWKKEVMENVTPASSSRVHFGEITVQPMITWSYAYRNARRGPWEQYARDRARFSSRIATVEAVLNPILENHHRQAMYCKLYG